jgi:hypothetical protein
MPLDQYRLIRYFNLGGQIGKADGYLLEGKEFYLKN